MIVASYWWLQNITKLYEELQQKGPVALESAPVAPQWPELSQLWELANSRDWSEADAACTTLVTLVQTRRLHLAYVLHGLINQAPATQ